VDGRHRAGEASWRVPVVLTEREVASLLAQLEGVSWLVATLLYGSGLRLLESLRLRVKDVDFERREITVRDGKGARDRRTMLPAKVAEPLGSHLDRVKSVHQRDLAEGHGEVYLPFALARKYRGLDARGPGSTCFRRAAGRQILWME
jgi:integrase